jgi:alpha-amylase
MIQTCRKNGVRVYADAVVNHMSGAASNVRRNNFGQCAYFDMNSTASSPFYSGQYSYNKNQWGDDYALEYPAVPYTQSDFHCDRALNDYASGFVMNYGWLVGLPDLNTEKDYVQDRIATYMATLLSIGFSGIRIDAAKVLFILYLQ